VQTVVQEKTRSRRDETIEGDPVRTSRYQNRATEAARKSDMVRNETRPPLCGAESQSRRRTVSENFTNERTQPAISEFAPNYVNHVFIYSFACNLGDAIAIGIVSDVEELRIVNSKLSLARRCMTLL